MSFLSCRQKSMQICITETNNSLKTGKCMTAIPSMLQNRVLLKGSVKLASNFNNGIFTAGHMTSDQ